MKISAIRKIFSLLIIFVMILCGCKSSDNKKYCVTFVDYDGAIISKQYVLTSSELEIPQAPSREGYVFTRWSKTIDKIDSDLIIIAEYRKESDEIYTIEFDANGGELIDGSSVQYLKAGQMPVVPTFYKEMTEFIGFDKEVSLVTESIKYKAMYKDLTIKNIDSFSLIKDMTFGWNYVNYMAEDNNDDKILDLLVERKINVLQLPINWMSHSNNDYTIKEESLRKVKKLVDLAISKGMYVVLGSYDSYYYEWSSLNYRNYEKLFNIVNIQWKQIGEYFKDYNEKLIFSFLGEPRDYDDNGLDGEAYHILNDINDYYVKLIRSLGGNNLYRHIILTTGWGKISGNAYEFFKVPVDKHIIVGVHCYTPFGFVHDDNLDEVSFTLKEKEYKSELLAIMETIDNNFIKKGIPAVISEFGSRDKKNSEERGKWLKYYLSCAENFGIKCFIWDCAKVHIDRDYTFGLINREINEWVFKEYTDVLDELINDKNYLDFYEEIRNVNNHSIKDSLHFPKILTSMLTGKTTSDFTVFYDKNKVVEINGEIFAKDIGDFYVGISVNDYNYYYKIEVLPEYRTTKTDFELSIRDNGSGYIQCYIETKHFSQMRVDYDWYSFDENLLTIDKYSTITCKGDGTTAIMAVNKKDKTVGIIEVVIKNRKIVSYNSFIQK